MKLIKAAEQAIGFRMCKPHIHYRMNHTARFASPLISRRWNACMQATASMDFGKNKLFTRAMLIYSHLSSLVFFWLMCV